MEGAPGRQRRRRAAGGLLALAAALLAGCGDGRAGRRVDYADALFDVADGGELRRDLKPYSCGEETHLSKLYARPLELERRHDGPAELIVSACAPEAAPDAHLVVRVGSGAAPARELTYALEAGWRTERFELGDGDGGTIRARLERRAPGGAPVFVRDFALRVERPLAVPRAAAPRALLVSLDTFRADAVGALGGAARTPALDRFLAESERMVPHWAAEISTKPSHASLLTGLPASVHGCDRGDVALASGASPLAERLRPAGVATAGFASQPVLLAAKYGFARGFELYRNEHWSPAPELRAAARWLAAQGDRPAFAFVHLYAAHSDGRRWPYESDAGSHREIARRFGLADYGCRDGRCGSALLLALNTDRRASRLPREGEILRALYDAGVEALDRELTVFFDDLRRAGLWDDLLVVLTADHGEAFDEHGYFLHTTAHEEVLRVPLAIKWPGGRRAGTTTGRASTALDLAPTLLAHFDRPAADLTGADLARPEPAETAFMTSLHAVRRGDWKLLLATPEHPEALYDLEADAAERRDRLAEQVEEAARLRDLLGRFEVAARRRSGEIGPGEPAGLESEEIAQLRALGYLP